MTKSVVTDLLQLSKLGILQLTNLKNIFPEKSIRFLNYMASKYSVTFPHNYQKFFFIAKKQSNRQDDFSATFTLWPY